MKNLSDEELINQAAGFSCGCDKCLARVEPPRGELLSRLARGQKAIEALERIEQHAYRPIREVNHSCDYMYAIDDIKQIIKEATDDRG